MPSRSQRHMTQMGRPTSGGVLPITLGIYFTGFQAAENIALGANLGTLSTLGTTGTPVFSLTNSDGNRVSLSGTSILRGATAWDFEAHPIVTFTVSVTGVTPTIAPTNFSMVAMNVLETVLAALTLSANTVPEGSPANTVVGAIQGRTAGSTLQLISGDAYFAISGTNLVTTSIPTDYETATSHSVTIRETHPDAAPRDTALTINVTNVAEGSLNALTLSTNTVAEDATIGTVVGTLQGKTSGSTLSLTGTAGGKFALSGTNIITAATLDYETATSHSITVRETLVEASNSPRDTILTVNVGDISEGGSDTTPDTFTFADQTNVALSTAFTSNAITVAGITAASPLTITGGQYSINGGAFASAATTVVNGDTVAVRVTSSGSNSTAVSATLTIGGVSDTFTVTTAAAAALGPFTLTWASADSERTNLVFSVDPGLLEGDSATLTLSANSDMSSPFAVSVSNVIDATEASAGTITFTGISVPLPANTATYARVNVVRGAGNADTNIVGPKTLYDPISITSSSSANALESAIFAHTLTASQAATFTIVPGGDGASYEISGSTLRNVGNGTSPAYAPGGDNDRTVTVRATATAVPTNTADQTITVNIQSASYRPTAIRMDGASTWLSRGGGFTGAADSKVGIISVWLKMMGDDGANQRLLYDTAGFTGLVRGTDNKIIFAHSGAVDIRTAATFAVGGGWKHLLMAWDGAAGVARVYVNGVSSPGTIVTAVNANVDWTLPDWGVLSYFNTPGESANAEVADLYINNAAYLDISNVTHLRKFISADGKPVNLGANGELPTGTAPLIYLGGSLATWHTNLGGGGGLTRNGSALTLAASNPADTAAPPITFTSLDSVGVNENVVLAHTLTASEACTFSIVGGADAARFELSGSTLRWLSNGTKNFEAPDDANADNAYLVTIRATATAVPTNTADQTITATVANVAESGGGTLVFTPTANPPSIDGPGITSPAVFTAVPIGTAAADRYVVVSLQHTGNNPGGNPSVVTIGGITAVKAVGDNTGERGADIWYALVPTGTTATISITITNGTGWSGGVNINVGSLTGSTDVVVASTVTEAKFNFVSNDKTAAVTVPTGGMAIMSAIADSPDSPALTWTNATKDYEQGFSEAMGSFRGSMAHTSTSATVTMTMTGGSSGGWIAAVFQP